MLARGDHRPPLVTAPRTVIGYHGCSRRTAERLLSDQQFLPSTRSHDWLGVGAYFWEYAPYRALDWAVVRAAQESDEPAVIRATIRLGRCLNLMDSFHFPGLLRVYELLAGEYGGGQMLRNTERGAHFLDRLIIEAHCRANADEAPTGFQTVRGSYAEGVPIFSGSKILSKAHTQIVVRDVSCITDVSLVHFP